MSINVDEFRVRPGETVDLAKRPTHVDPVYASKEDYIEQLRKHKKRLKKLQYGLYASDTYSLLLIFQAMDAAGKDGAISHVMSGVNPQGCQVHSFVHPGPMELDHDFLWRTTLWLPERGRIGIFNRSYYEEVLIVRVHPEILKAENLPEKLLEDHSIWNQRYQSIVDHERHLHHNGTKVIKFFLHISQEEQTGRGGTGSLASRTSKNASIGTPTWRRTRPASARQAPPTLPGMRCRRMTRKMRACSCHRPWSTRLSHSTSVSPSSMSNACANLRQFERNSMAPSTATRAARVGTGSRGTRLTACP
jgi:polyphosphate kinase 2 (PPK2 family)